MQVHPKTAEENLGFSEIRRRLRELLLSSMGEDALRDMKASHDEAVVRTELSRVAELQEALTKGESVPLGGHIDIRDVLVRAAPDGAWVEPKDLVSVRAVAGAMRRLRAFFADGRYQKLAKLTGRITELRGLEEFIDEIVDQEGAVRDTASADLRRIRRLLSHKRAAVRAKVHEELRKAQKRGYASEMQPTLRGGRMVIPLHAEAKRKVRGFVHDQSASGQTVYMEPAACLALNNDVRILEGDERREVERILRLATTRIRAVGETLHRNLLCMVQFDLVQAKARLGNRLQAVVPRLNRSGVFDIRQGRNPLLILLQQGSVVPLDLLIGEDTTTLVITGPNAGGKTVAMKTVGLFVLMLSYGIPVPAHQHSSFCLVHRLLVEIGDEQSIEHDLSTFGARVRGLQRMIADADRHALILIDEIGTGTDPSEGAALAQAALERLTKAGARTIVTTHHGTLKAWAHEAAGVENGSMEFDRQTLCPTYLFSQGLPGSSYAFDIAERMHLDMHVLERARTLIGSKQRALEDLIATFELRTQELERRLSMLPSKPQGSKPRKLPRDEGVPAATPKKPSEDFKVGDRVRLYGQSQIGEIVDRDGRKAVVVFGSNRWPVDVGRLEKITGGKKRPTVRFPPRIRGARKRLDLHGFRVDKALVAVKHHIDRAVAADFDEVEILHGVGTWQLSNAIRDFLPNDTRISEFETAAGNPGITIVRLK